MSCQASFAYNDGCYTRCHILQALLVLVVVDLPCGLAPALMPFIRRARAIALLALVSLVSNNSFKTPGTARGTLTTANHQRGVGLPAIFYFAVVVS